jgi:hypothetical protein
MRIEFARSVGSNGALNYLAIKNPDLFELIAPRLRGRDYIVAVTVFLLHFFLRSVLLRCKPFFISLLYFLIPTRYSHLFLSLCHHLYLLPLFFVLFLCFLPFLMYHFVY